ncbi:PQQ-binding-like beta-propeller repeat protein [Actinoplanes sp. NPDC051633]|uniref:outer membrane protein assembly factor BamB family protein n=1 Tax=Actinoplanes sp. NPDC051633 TaxID=3155670 RepID=UPI003419D76E
MTVIELGEVSSGNPQPPAAERPWRLGHLRWVAMAAVLVVCALTVTGSAVPAEPRGLRTLWSVPSASQPFQLQGDALYLFRAGESPAVERYDAATGRLRWTHQTERPIDWAYTWVPGLVIVPVPVEQPDGTSVSQDFVALDAETGRTLWQRRGDPNFGDRSTLLLTESDPAGAVAKVVMVRPSDGTELWSFTPSERVAGWTTMYGADQNRPQWFATVTDAGKVELRRTSDGSLMRTGKVPWATVEPGAGNNGDGAYLYSFGDVLASVLQKDGALAMNAFDVRTMRQIWTWTGRGEGGAFNCGKLICFTGQPGVEAIDPVTGDVVWRSASWDWARPFDATRMLYESQGQGNQGLLDAATGRFVTMFPRGMVAEDVPNADLVVLAFTETVPAQMAVYRLRGNRLELRGGMGGSTDQGCQYANSRLVCMMGLGTERALVVKAVG